MRLALALRGLAAFALPLGLSAQNDPGAPDGTIVATVDGAPVTSAEVQIASVPLRARAAQQAQEAQWRHEGESIDDARSRITRAAGRQAAIEAKVIQNWAAQCQVGTVIDLQRFAAESGPGRFGPTTLSLRECYVSAVDEMRAQLERQFTQHALAHQDIPADLTPDQVAGIKADLHRRFLAELANHARAARVVIR